MDVKTFGRVNVLTVNNAITTLKGITLTVRSGAEVSYHVFILIIIINEHASRYGISENIITGT